MGFSLRLNRFSVFFNYTMKTFTAIVLVAIVAVAIAKPLTRALTNRDNCGTQKVSNLRIVNGMNAYYGQFPWQISLQFKITSNRKMHVCGGSIIDDQWILTASHCFLNSKDPAKYVVRIGTFNQTAGSAEPEAVEHDLDKIIQHEGFKLILKIRNDIALIKLSKPINFDNEYVNTVCMPTDSKFNNVDGSELVVSGWGDTLPGSQTNVPDLLQWTKLTPLHARETLEVLLSLTKPKRAARFKSVLFLSEMPTATMPSQQCSPESPTTWTGSRRT